MSHAMSESRHPEELQIGRMRRLLGRALRLRCPACGEGALFSGWIKLRTKCDGCGLHFERGEHDHFLGAYLVNFIIAELLVVAGLVVAMLLTWPDVPWNALKLWLIIMIVPAPVVTYPFSRAVWLALDLQFQPYRPGDYGTDRS